MIRNLRDITLLNLLQADAAATAETLSGPVALSPSALSRRVRRLKSGGEIGGTHAVLAPRITERRLRALVVIELAEHADVAAIGALSEKLQGEERVQLLLTVAGEIDLVALVVVRDMEEFNRLAEELLESSSIVRRYRTHFAKRVLKQSTFIRLGEQDLQPPQGPKPAS